MQVRTGTAKHVLQFLSTSAFALCTVLCSPAAQDIKALQKIYTDAKAKIDSAYEQKLTRIGEKYARQLAAQIAQAKNKGDLRGYKKLVAEQERLANEKTLPGDSALIKHVRSARHGMAAEVIALSNKYVARLQKLKVALMKGDKIADAEAVGGEIQRIKFIVADLEVKLKDRAVGKGPASPGRTGESAYPSSLTEGLVLHYDFNTRVTDTVKDLSDHGNDGKVSGAKWLSNGRGLRDGAVQFDGKSDTIMVAHTPSLAFDRELTVALWARVDDGKRRQSLVAKYHVGYRQRGFALEYNDLRVKVTPARSVQATVCSRSDAFKGGKVFANKTLTQRKWHHIVLRFSPLRLRVYVDGKDHTGGVAFGTQPESMNPSIRPICIGSAEESPDTASTAASTTS
jgi:hypothetical protein